MTGCRPNLTLLFACVALIACAPRAAACSCLAPGDLVEEARATDIVFSGTVVQDKGMHRADSPLMARIKSLLGMRVRHWPDERTFVLRVDEPFKGIQGATVDVVTAADGAACGYSFQVGRRYLVFAQRQADRLWVSLCSSTAALEDHPARDIARLREGRLDETAGNTVPRDGK